MRSQLGKLNWQLLQSQYMFPDFTSRSCANSTTCQGSTGSAPPDGLDRAHQHLTSADHGWHEALFNLVTAVFLLDRIAQRILPDSSDITAVSLGSNQQKHLFSAAASGCDAALASPRSLT